MKIDALVRDTSWLTRLKIRPMVASDLPLLEWDGEYRHFRKVYADAYKRYMNGLSVLWVAELEGQDLIGQAFVQLTCDRPELANGIDRAYLYSLRVRPSFRGAGVGSKIMESAEEDLMDREFRTITLNVARDNLRAQSLYFRRGYRIIAPEPGRWSYQDDHGEWQHVVEPAWRMEKSLI